MRLTTNKLTWAVRTALVVGVAGVVGHADPVFAQTPDTASLERVQVVGSRIKRVDAESSQPTFEITARDIEISGLTTVGDVLQRLTGSGAALNTLFNNGGDGSTRVSLRTLGAGRTLVLVNGRRWVGGGLFGSTDLNSIPSAAVDSIQVLKDGASAIYGSDAIAGVIDVRLKTNYQGAEYSGFLGQQAKGDGRRMSSNFLIGFTGERGNVMMGVGYVQEDPTFAGDRDRSAVPLFGLPAEDTLFAGASGVGPRARLFSGSTGQLILERGASGTSPGDFRPFNSVVDGYNFAPDNYLQTPQERVSFFSDARYSVLDNVDFFSTFIFNERQSDQLLAAMPVAWGVFNGVPAANRINTSADNVYNPFGQDFSGGARRFTETGGRLFEQNVTTYNFVGGFDGDFQAADRFFSWDVGYQFAKTRQSDRTAGLINLLNLERGLGPSFFDASGVARCGTPGAVIAGCVPLNVFGPDGSLTPEMINYATFIEQGNRENTLTNYWANLTGDLFEIVSGRPVQFATGVEYRKDTARDTPDAFTNAGLSSGNGRAGTEGSVKVQEFYAELLIPVLADAPLAESLEFRVAGRYSDYEAFGDTTNLSGGFKWQPVSDVAIRGNWAEGFRAPTVGDLFRGASDSFPNVSDPCSSQRILTLNEASRQRCYADGVPTDNSYTQLSSQIRVTLGGNPFLSPEETVNRTLGIVYSPSFLEGFDISLDWYKIKLENGIGSRSANFIINECYTADSAADRALYCPLVSRAPDASVNDILVGPINFTRNVVEGYDVTARYALDTDFGRFTWVWDNTYTTKWLTFNDAGESTQNAGRGFGAPNYWRVRSNLSTRWNFGDWDVDYAMRFYGAVNESCTFLRGVEAALNVPSPCSDMTRRIETGLSERNRLGGTTYHDLRVAWSTPWNSSIALGVNNVWDKDPPFSAQAFSNSFAPDYGAPGSRFVYMQYNQRF